MAEEDLSELSPGPTAFFGNEDVRLHDSMNFTEMLESNEYIMPWYQQAIWSSLFGLMVTVAAGGNIIVIWIVLVHKRMRTVTNYFILNLSLADTMVSTLNVSVNFVYLLNNDWPFGELYCKFSNFLAIVSVGASVLTLMAIAIDRYTAIMHPLKPRMSRGKNVIIMLLIWSGSSLLSLPNLIFSKTEKEFFKNGDSRVICFMEWPDGPSTKSFEEYVYNVIILLVTYVVPILAMGVTYFRVGLELWGSQSIGETTSKQIESIKSKRKIVKMMIVVVLIFSICWLPYHVYFLVVHHYPEITNWEYIQPLYLSIYFLAMSNSMYNPIIYCWMNGRFRAGFKKVFCCACMRGVTTQLNPESRFSRKTRFSCTETTAETRVRVNGGNEFGLKTLTERLNNEDSLNAAGRNSRAKVEEGSL